MLAHKFRDRAKREIVDIYLEYEAAKPSLGNRFLTKLADRIDLIQHVPEMYALKRGIYRIGQMKPFPQLIIYSVEPTEIVIYTIVHGRRDLEALWRGLP